MVRPVLGNRKQYWELELIVNGHLYSFKLNLQKGLEIISSCFHLKELSFKFTIKVPSSKLSTHLAENGLKFLQIWRGTFRWRNNLRNAIIVVKINKSAMLWMHALRSTYPSTLFEQRWLWDMFCESGNSQASMGKEHIMQAMEMLLEFRIWMQALLEKVCCNAAATSGLPSSSAAIFCY